MICGTTVIYRCASYQLSKSYTRPILRSVLAMKMGQVPTESYTEQATSHGYKGLPSDKRENAQLRRNLLVEQKGGNIRSFATCITALPQRFCFEPGYVLQVHAQSVGPLRNMFQFSSFSVAVDGNVNKPLSLESVT